MALQSSGPISLANIQSEFGGSNPISLSEYYRNGSYTTSNNTNVPTGGTISMGNFYGAVKQFQHTITSHQQELNLYNYLTGQGWNGSDPIALTINSGVYIWSNNTATAGLIISSAFSSLLSITNNGYIMGKGGAGGNVPSAGSAGGPAISNLASGISFYNTSSGFIGGGGGGGGAGYYQGCGGGGGGGAGGGVGGYGIDGGSGVMSGGAGGSIGNKGGDAAYDPWGTIGQGGQAGGSGGGLSASGSGAHDASGGGGGGRIFPGVIEYAQTAGGSNTVNASGGYGGGAGQNGGGPTHSAAGGGGGGWGAAGASSYAAGGAAGKAVTGTAIPFSGTTSQIYGANG